MNKDLKKLLKYYAKLDFIFMNGSKHIKATHKYAKGIVIIPKTPSDFRTIKIVKRNLDRMLQCK